MNNPLADKVFTKSKNMRDRAQQDVRAILLLIEEHNRLKNMVVNAVRDVHMWTTRLDYLTKNPAPPNSLLGTRPYDVAVESLAKVKQAWENLRVGVQQHHVEDLRIAAATALFAKLDEVANGPFDWVAIAKSRDRRLAKANNQVSKLRRDSRAVRRAGMKLRRQAITALEAHSGLEAVDLIKQSQETLKQEREFETPLRLATKRRDFLLEKTDVIFLREWLVTLLPQREEILKRTDPLKPEPDTEQFVGVYEPGKA